jgi:hypothetical protein
MSSKPARPGGWRWPRAAPWVAVGAVAAAVGVAAALATGGAQPSEPPGRVVKIPTRFDQIGVPADEAGCSPVRSPKVQPNAVVSSAEPEHPPYSSTPPTSGWHFFDPLPAAGYLLPHDPEAVVANLADGDVAVWHVGLTEEERQDLIGLFVLLKSEYILAVSGEELGLDHKIVLTAWGKLQECEQLSGPVIARFFERYRGLGPGLDQTP